MTDHADLFVQQEDVLVLIDDIELLSRFEKVIMLLFFKKLVLDIKG